MKKGLLSTVVEFAGFALAGVLFFVWFLGYNKNNNAVLGPNDESKVLRSEFGASYEATNASEYDHADYATLSSADYKGTSFKRPNPVSSKLKTYRPVSRTENENHTTATPRVSPQKLTVLRSWKGVHRDESYAWQCFNRFGKHVANLSEEYGLYPQIMMARIIAYSYEYISNPNDKLFDQNFTAMKRPKGEERARFKSSLESLKAYAIVNAGEITRLSASGAVAKHDRSWTMQKIIDKYAFISDLGKDAKEDSDYAGIVGKANKVSAKENYKREVKGEAIKMVSNIEDKVKKRRAKGAGFDNWEDYLENLPEEEKVKLEKEAASTISAISKKKAFNLSRRVGAKKRKK